MLGGDRQIPVSDAKGRDLAIPGSPTWCFSNSSNLLFQSRPRAKPPRRMSTVSSVIIAKPDSTATTAYPYTIAGQQAHHGEAEDLVEIEPEEQQVAAEQCTQQ